MRIQILILRFKGLSLVVICLENPRRLATLLFPGHPKFCQIMKTQHLRYPKLFRMVGDKLVELEIGQAARRSGVRSLRRPWKLGLRIVLRDRSHACFAKKAQERLNLELFGNASVHEFYGLKPLITLEQVNTTEWLGKNIRVLISKTAMVFIVCKLRKPRRIFRLPTSDLRPYFKLQTSDLTKFELRISDFWPFRLNPAWLNF